jgi:hypothetical protein
MRKGQVIVTRKVHGRHGNSDKNKAAPATTTQTREWTTCKDEDVAAGLIPQLEVPHFCSPEQFT